MSRHQSGVAFKAVLAASSLGQDFAETKAWQELGDQIADARRSAWVSRDTVLWRSGLADSQLADIERGLANMDGQFNVYGPTDAELQAIADALDISAEPWIAEAARIRRGNP